MTTKLLAPALRGALHAPPLLPSRQRSLVLLGAGGTLGSAVLAEALVAGRFRCVQAIVEGPLASAMRGLEPLARESLVADTPVVAPDSTAVIVFERQRHSNGRDNAFVQPAVTELLPWAEVFLRQGVRRLLVVVPHAPALLPQALRHGLATLDEAAVQMLGFEHLLFLRAPQHAVSGSKGSVPQRLAAWWLSQLRWMVPQQEQPMRAVGLARCVAVLVQGLADAPPGTRVLSPQALSSGAAGAAVGLAAVGTWPDPVASQPPKP